MLLTLGTPFKAVADSFYIQPAELEPGKTETLRFVLENSQDYYGFQAEVRLPAGLEAVMESNGMLDITLSARADEGNFRVNSNLLPDGTLIMGAFSASRKPFTGNAGVLVSLNVSVADDFAGGAVDVYDVMFIDSQDKDVEFDSTSAYLGVMPVLVESLTIDPTVWNGVEGSEFTIKATVLPEDAADKSLKFESTDPKIATVDDEGNVKVIKEGFCSIIVSTLDGSGLTAECQITGLSGVESVFADPDATVDVYDVNGTRLKQGCTRGQLKQLKPAVYILRSGNAIVKTVVR